MKIEKYFGISREAARQMINATKSMTHEKSGDNGFQNTKVFLFDKYAVLAMQNINVRNVCIPDPDLKHLEKLAEILLDLQAKGVNVVPILAFQSDSGNGYIIQSRASGTELYDRDKVNDKNYVLRRVELLSNAPQEHFDKLVADTLRITDAGVLIDFMGKDNFFYHETTGFHFIDLNAQYDYAYGLTNEKPNSKQIAAYGCFVPCYYDTDPKHRDTVSKIMSALTDEKSILLKRQNKIIFEKCKIAMLQNQITKKLIDETLANNWFMPQRQQLGLL